MAIFTPGRELQLVARDVRARRRAPMTCASHAEVAERLDEAGGGLLLAGGVGLDLLGGRALEDAGVGQAELDVAGIEVLERGLVLVVGPRPGLVRGARRLLGLGLGSGAAPRRLRPRARGGATRGLEEVGVAQRAVEVAARASPGG